MSLPEIVSVKWGEIVVKLDAEHEKKYKDCRIWAHDSDNWDWGRTGTRHTPGTQFDDFADLLGKCPETDTIILSTGMQNVLKVHPETVKTLVQWAKNGPKRNFYMVNTNSAVKLYNNMRKTHQIVALFHTTC